MSVRAYKVIEIRTAETPSFNLWHDDSLRNHLLQDGNGLNDDGCGLLDVPVGVLREALQELTDIPDDVRQALEQDLKAAEVEDSITYYCY